MPTYTAAQLEAEKKVDRVSHPRPIRLKEQTLRLAKSKYERLLKEEEDLKRSQADAGLRTQVAGNLERKESNAVLPIATGAGPETAPAIERSEHAGLAELPPITETIIRRGEEILTSKQVEILAPAAKPVEPVEAPKSEQQPVQSPPRRLSMRDGIQAPRPVRQRQNGSNDNRRNGVGNKPAGQ